MWLGVKTIYNSRERQTDFTLTPIYTGTDTDTNTDTDTDTENDTDIEALMLHKFN